MYRMTPDDPTASSLEGQIAAWRSHLRASRAISAEDAAELEDHLREQIARLGADGLSEDEAFLVAVKRMGAIDALTREFAREHSERLWKQLVLTGDGWAGGAEAVGGEGSRRMWVALALAVVAAAAMKVPALFGISFDPDRSLFYPTNIGFLTFPFVAAYFAWERPLRTASRAWLAAAFLLGAAVVNAFPFPMETTGAGEPDTHGLMMLHLPIVLWLGVGVAYVGGRWRGNERRMDFIRFTGEFFIYFVLFALGGGVLIALTAALFEAIGVDAQPFVVDWLLPCGIAGAMVIAAWLVEAKQSVIENMAPVLARISGMGWTPNRFAALGMNVVLLANLAGSAFLYGRFLRGAGTFQRLWSWQMFYLYVIAGWSAVVAFLFPPLFGFA